MDWGSTLRDLAQQAALLLLVGGLTMLSVIVVLVAVQNIFPDRSPDPSSATAGRELRPMAGGPVSRPKLVPRAAFGRRQAFAPQAPLELALGRLVERHLGEPRVLRARDHLTRLRVYACRDCEGVPEGSASSPSCAREAGAIAAIFQGIHGPRTAVRETACRLTGHPACEFEVVH